MPSLIQLLNLKNIKMVLRNMWKVGPITTARYVISDMLFDMKYKVETINTIMLGELEINSPNKAHGHYYEGTNTHVFNRVFSQIKVDAPKQVFVDFGSGKGRAMILAAERGFRKIIGVEFSGALVDICHRNLEIFKANAKIKPEFEVIHADAAEYVIPNEASFLYFANPFDETLIAKVIANILKSLEASPREITILHLFPQGNTAFVDHPRLQLVSELTYGYVLRVKPSA